MSDFINIGDIVSMSSPIVVTNNGPAVALNVVVTFTFPASISVTSFTPSIGAFDTLSNEWVVGAMNPSGISSEATIDFTFQIVDPCDLPIDISYVVTSDTVDADLTNNNSTKVIEGNSCCNVIECITDTFYDKVEVDALLIGASPVVVGIPSFQEIKVGSIPVTLIDPIYTGIDLVNGVLINQIYDDGMVVSTYDGVVWTNTAIPGNTNLAANDLIQAAEARVYDANGQNLRWENIVDLDTAATGNITTTAYGTINQAATGNYIVSGSGYAAYSAGNYNTNVVGNVTHIIGGDRAAVITGNETVTCDALLQNNANYTNTSSTTVDITAGTNLTTTSVDNTTIATGNMVNTVTGNLTDTVTGDIITTAAVSTTTTTGSITLDAGNVITITTPIFGDINIDAASNVAIDAVGGIDLDSFIGLYRIINPPSLLNSTNDTEYLVRSLATGNIERRSVSYTHTYVAADWSGTNTITILPATHGMGIGSFHVTPFLSNNDVTDTSVNIDPATGIITLTTGGPHDGYSYISK